MTPSRDSDQDNSDAALPEDLRPGAGNPLAEPLDPDDEATKDVDELGMSDTQADTAGSYRSSGDLEESERTSADDVEGEKSNS